MAKAFDTWTVLAHETLEKHSDSFWTVNGTMPDGKTRRVMSIAKMRDGRLLIHNAIALDEPSMAEIEALGTPSVLVVPGGFHRQDAKIYKDRYKSMKVYCPSGARAKVAAVVPVDGSYADAPTDPNVSLVELNGTKGREGVLQSKGAHGIAVVFNDAINNLPSMTGAFGFFFAPTGRPAVPRLARWIMVADKKAMRAHLETLAGIGDLSRIVVSHGKPMTDKPGEILRAVGAELTG